MQIFWMSKMEYSLLYLFNELQNEVLVYLDMYTITKMRNVNKFYSKYIKSKQFWNFYISKLNQYRYRKLFKKVCGFKNTWLINLLMKDYEHVMLENCMILHVFKDARKWGGIKIMKKCRRLVTNQTCLEYMRTPNYDNILLDYRSTKKLIKKGFNQKAVVQLIAFIENMGLSSMSFTLLSYAPNIEVLEKYCNTFNIKLIFLCELFISNIGTYANKNCYNLYMEIINRYEFDLKSIYNDENIKSRNQLYGCHDKLLLDHLIKEKVITIDYEYLKNYESNIHIPTCEYYIVKFYEDLLNILDKECYPDPLKINLLWCCILEGIDKIDDDKLFKMIQDVPDRYYDESFCVMIVDELKYDGRDYLSRILYSHISDCQKR